jgi:DNA polymerase III alpha subunit
MIERYIEMFGKEHYYLEMMMLDFVKQKPYNAFIVKAAEKFGLKVIVTNDCHYCQQEDSHFQRLMLMVQTGKTIQDIQKAMAEDAMQDFFELQDANLWMKSEEKLTTNGNVTIATWCRMNCFVRPSETRSAFATKPKA